MRRIVPPPVLWIAGLALVLAACGGDGAATTTTTTAPPSTTIATTTTVATTTTSTTTTTTLPSGPALAEEGDRNEIVAAFQFLLNCNDYGDLKVDGAFGPATLAAVEAAQEELGRQVNGAPDEETLAELSRSCDETRSFEGEGEFTIVGNASPEDPETYEIALLSNSTVTVATAPSAGLTLTLADAAGAVVEPEGPLAWAITTTGDYLLEVAPADGQMTFSLDITVTETERAVGDWVLATDGLIYKETKLALGSNAGTVITKVFGFLGHGVRGNLDEFDTDWYTVTDPADMGLRGIFIEGFALLFYGPDPNNLDRPETFARWRFVGPTVDANGQPRPDNYATTAAGITVGDTLADLKSAYGSEVTPGSNDDEHWYRLVYSTGDICFYFEGGNAPTDASPISEISSECRFG